ncbi:hypothetical protein H8E07_08670 [bacterium]|nr:hypothetical protein [bacterium]
MNGSRSRARRHAAACACAFLTLATLLPAAVMAAAPWAEPLPWEAVTGDTGFTFDVQRFDDPDSGWQVDAFGMTSVMHQGEVNRVYVRWRHLDFHTAGRSALARWPEAVPPVADGETPDLSWPGEHSVAGWGRPELGLLAPLSLPLIGDSLFGGEVALPFARNALYPFAARSTSLRLALRRVFRLGERLTGALVCERVLNMSAAGEDLADEAFADLTVWGGSLAWRPARSADLRLSARDAGPGECRRLRLSLTVPWGEGRGFTLGLMRGLADAEDRLFATQVTVAVSIALDTPSADAPQTPPEEGP